MLLKVNSQDRERGAKVLQLPFQDSQHQRLQARLQILCIPRLTINLPWTPDLRLQEFWRSTQLIQDQGYQGLVQDQLLALTQGMPLVHQDPRVRGGRDRLRLPRQLLRIHRGQLLLGLDRVLLPKCHESVLKTKVET